jgi:hypothetical protein
MCGTVTLGSKAGENLSISRCWRTTFLISTSFGIETDSNGILGGGQRFIAHDELSPPGDEFFCGHEKSRGMRPSRLIHKE